MKNKILIIIIPFFTALILLAGIFYWQTRQFNIQKKPNTATQNEKNNLPIQERGIATSSPPFIAKGEISGGNPNKKQIIFTFDAGAGINSAQKILEVAQKYGVKITFFVTGSFAEKNPELIKQIAGAGYEIFNHTYSHPHLTQSTEEQIKTELDKTDNVISNLTGQTTKPYFRPPYGDRNDSVLNIAKNEGYQSVYWTLDALDWETDKTAEEVKQRIYNNLKPGAIILMHVGDDITGNILDEVIVYVKSQGYKIVSLSEGLK